MTTHQSNITFKSVFEKEREIIKQQRENREDTNLKEKDPDTLIGLAISGGGIRSASFALGVLQSLDKNNKLRSIDYLSTVSGGGYIGAWLSANCKRTADLNEEARQNNYPPKPGWQPPEPAGKCILKN